VKRAAPGEGPSAMVSFRMGVKLKTRAQAIAIRLEMDLSDLLIHYIREGVGLEEEAYAKECELGGGDRRGGERRGTPRGDGT